eukprot:symbB.v1.2.039387.t1/scaffold6530.1/size17355/2
MPSQVFVSIPDALRQFLVSDCRAEGAKEAAEKSSGDLDELYRLAEEHQKLTQDSGCFRQDIMSLEVIDTQCQMCHGSPGACKDA